MEGERRMKYYIGIDLGGTNVRTLLVDENGKTYSEVKDATEREKGPDFEIGRAHV